MRFNLKNEESENERFVEARAQFSRFHGMLFGRKMDVNSASGVEESVLRPKTLKNGGKKKFANLKIVFF